MNSRIQVTHIQVNPLDGWLIAYYCETCKKTTFLLSPYALKPKDGDYFLVKMCADELSHNIKMPKFEFGFEKNS